MSQSTIIVVDTGLDKFDLYCGSRQPAQSLGIELFDAKTYADDAAGWLTVTVSRHD